MSSRKPKQIFVQPNDLVEILNLKDEKGVDIAYSAASTILAQLNYLVPGDSLTMAGLTFTKITDRHLEIGNKLDIKDLTELIDEEID